MCEPFDRLRVRCGSVWYWIPGQARNDESMYLCINEFLKTSVFRSIVILKVKDRCFALLSMTKNANLLKR